MEDLRTKIAELNKDIQKFEQAKQNASDGKVVMLPDGRKSDGTRQGAVAVYDEIIQHLIEARDLLSRNL